MKLELSPGECLGWNGVADPSKAEAELGWKAEFTIEDMVRDAWGSWWGLTY